MILTETKKNIDILCGKFPLIGNVKTIFDEKVICFLNSISNVIIQEKSYNEFKDLKTFGFWCRKGNILRLSKNYISSYLQMGRGIVFHITPSNVALNFAYSLAFGLLSGNQNIVRLPSKNFDQSNILCELINNALNKKEFNDLKHNICLIKYDRNDDVSSNLSKISNARLIWGGDETINKFKEFYTTPRCVDIMFSNRYSASVINVESIKKLNNNELKNLVSKFYRDSYLMDQKGCSSPQSIIWLGKDNNETKIRFWETLNKLVSSEYDDDFSVTNEKFFNISITAAKTDFPYKAIYKNFKLVRYNLNDYYSEIPNLRGSFGVFTEVSVEKIEDLTVIFKNNFQTLTYFGIEREHINKFIKNNGLLGIDRIVPIGRAFDIGPVWDGYDVIQSLSRIISN